MTFNEKQHTLLRRLNSRLLFRIFTRKMVPAAAHAGVKFVSLTDRECSIVVPNKRRNRNPFRSMYFAVQSMAAEMSTALPAMLFLEGVDSSIAWIVVDFEASFPTKAVDDVTFTCGPFDELKAAIDLAAQGGDAQTVKLETVGRMPDGTVVSTFVFHWSFKKRK